ncbi:MAG: hypothetical protein A2017_08795 [Lentisphaerae bacterium GWF2_44_16]|nr:MAG: hypothetical protein A2017_08795 [Lentisphaerae bacterium GWF2_44_16]
MADIIDQCWFSRPEGLPEHICAGGIVVRYHNNSAYIAFVKEKAFSSCFLPKGKVEKGESTEAAAKREIGEETGITELILMEYLGCFERMDYKKTSWKKIHYYLFSSTQKNAVPTDSNHEYELKWFPCGKLPQILWPEQKKLIEENLFKIINGGIKK